MFFVLWEQRKKSVSERGIRRSEVRFLIGTKKHLSLFRAQNLPSLLFYVQATFPITLFHLFHTKQNQRCLGVASWLSQSFASCAAHGFCAYGPMNFVRNITWIEIEGNCIFETCWLRSHIKLPWNNIMLLLRDIQVFGKGFIECSQFASGEVSEIDLAYFSLFNFSTFRKNSAFLYSE